MSKWHLIKSTEELKKVYNFYIEMISASQEINRWWNATYIYMFSLFDMKQEFSEL